MTVYLYKGGAAIVFYHFSHLLCLLSTQYLSQELQFFNTEEKLEDPGVKESVKVCMEAVAAGNLPLVDSSPTTAIKVIAGGYDAKADMEAEDAGGDIEILGKGGG